MRRRRFLVGVSTGGIVTTTGCLRRGGRTEIPKPSFSVTDTGFVVDDGSSPQEHLARGINLGMAKPGHFPGEAAITREQYDRWLSQIGEMGANIVRVYTVHPPRFYEVLQAYNEGADDPLYLLHGTWIDEEALNETGDAFQMSDQFEADLRTTVDVIHGDASLPTEPGSPGGEYEADVSAYTIGYIAGIEWHPTLVLETNDRNAPGTFEGEYLASTVERPFERWLARSLDELIGYEDAKYGEQRPVAFTNWVTTDPLDQPYEPFHLENIATVDPDALAPTAAFDAGTFAAYHVYPYYPDFLNETPEYIEYLDHRGEKNSYAGYLNDLTSVTEHPLLIAEFGVPSSRGIAHKHVHGRHQGRHTETEQGAIVADMYEDIVNADTVGGLIFTWQDEWFKRTWNLQRFADQHRRPRWLNVQSPEQRFGLLSFDPSGRISLDGSTDGWQETERFTPSGAPKDLDGDAAERLRLDGLSVTSDEAYLYLRIERPSGVPSLDWSTTAYMLTISLSGRGNQTLPFGTESRSPPTDFVVYLGGPNQSRVLVDAYYDAFAYLYGEEAGLDMDMYRTRNSGRFTPIRMAINRGYTVPATGEEVPFDAVETGRLRFGTANPASKAYDSLTDVHVSEGSIELRLPWLMLNVADPSNRRRLGDLWEDGLDIFPGFDTIEIAVASFLPDGTERARTIQGETNLVHAIPGTEGDKLQTVAFDPPIWNEPSYQERLKESYGAVNTVYESYR